MAGWRLKTDQIRFGVTFRCQQTWQWEIPYEWTFEWENHLLIDEVLSIARFVCRKVRQSMTKFMDWHSSFNLWTKARGKQPSANLRLDQQHSISSSHPKATYIYIYIHENTHQRCFLLLTLFFKQNDDDDDVKILILHILIAIGSDLIQHATSISARQGQRWESVTRRRTVTGWPIGGWMWGVTPAMKIGTFRHQKKEGLEPRNMEVSPIINEQMWNSPMNSFGCVWK